MGGRLREHVLANASARVETIQQLDADVHAAGFGPRVAAQATLIADELLSNALYNAPLDAAGVRYRGDEPRHGNRPLVGNEQVTLRYACDARYSRLPAGKPIGVLGDDGMQPDYLEAGAQ